MREVVTQGMRDAINTPLDLSPRGPSNPFQALPPEYYQGAYDISRGPYQGEAPSPPLARAMVSYTLGAFLGFFGVVGVYYFGGLGMW